MATRVQDAEIFATNYSTQTRVLNGVGAGNLLAASVVGGSTTITHTIADNNGGSWNTITGLDPFTNTTPALRGYIWYAANHASGNTTITWTPSASATGFCGCVEYSGLATSSPVEDSDAAYNAGTTSHATPSLTRTVGGAIYAVMQSSTNASWTAGTDFVDLGAGGSARAIHESAELASGNHTASATSAANEDAIILGVAFKDAAGASQTGRITAAQAEATYTAKTGRIAATQAEATYSEKTGRITAAQAEATYSAKTGRTTAASAEVTFSEKTARITASEAEATYSEKTGRITGVEAEVTWQPASGRVLAVQAEVTYDAKTGRITGTQAEATYSEKLGRITATQAAIDWQPASGRITGVQAEATYSEKTARITASSAEATYSEKTARIAAVQAAIDWTAAFARIFACEVIVTYTVGEVVTPRPILARGRERFYTQPEVIPAESKPATGAKPSRRTWPKWR